MQIYINIYSAYNHFQIYKNATIANFVCFRKTWMNITETDHYIP